MSHPRPGTLTKLTLTNFQTYKHATFTFSPKLNFIAAPNGSGKSTLTNALAFIFLGTPKTLSKNCDLSAYVRFGCENATISVEIVSNSKYKYKEKCDKNGNVRTDVLKRVIFSNRSVFYVNDEKVTKSVYSEVVMSYDIDVTNLTQFLPQERVSEFARLSGEDLLKEVLKSCSISNIADNEDQEVNENEMENEKDVKENDVKEVKELKGNEKDVKYNGGSNNSNKISNNSNKISMNNSGSKKSMNNIKEDSTYNNNTQNKSNTQSRSNIQSKINSINNNSNTQNKLNIQNNLNLKSNSLRSGKDLLSNILTLHQDEQTLKTLCTNLDTVQTFHTTTAKQVRTLQLEVDKHAARQQKEQHITNMKYKITFMRYDTAVKNKCTYASALKDLETTLTTIRSTITTCENEIRKISDNKVCAEIHRLCGDYKISNDILDCLVRRMQDEIKARDLCEVDLRSAEKKMAKVRDEVRILKEKMVDFEKRLRMTVEIDKRVGEDEIRKRLDRVVSGMKEKYTLEENKMIDFGRSVRVLKSIENGMNGSYNLSIVTKKMIDMRHEEKVDIRMNETRIKDESVKMQGMLEELQRAKQNITDEGKKRLESLRNNNRDCHDAVTWLRNNKNYFKSEVLEPSVLSIGIKRREYVGEVEGCLGNNLLYTFVCGNKDDFAMFTQKVKTELRLRVNVMEICMLNKNCDDGNRNDGNRNENCDDGNRNDGNRNENCDDGNRNDGNGNMNENENRNGNVNGNIIKNGIKNSNSVNSNNSDNNIVNNSDNNIISSKNGITNSVFKSTAPEVFDGFVIDFIDARPEYLHLFETLGNLHRIPVSKKNLNTDTLFKQHNYRKMIINNRYLEKKMSRYGNDHVLIDSSLKCKNIFTATSRHELADIESKFNDLKTKRDTNNKQLNMYLRHREVVEGELQAVFAISEEHKTLVSNADEIVRRRENLRRQIENCGREICEKEAVSDEVEKVKKVLVIAEKRIGDVIGRIWEEMQKETADLRRSEEGPNSNNNSNNNSNDGINSTNNNNNNNSNDGINSNNNNNNNNGNEGLNSNTNSNNDGSGTLAEFINTQNNTVFDNKNTNSNNNKNNNKTSTCDEDLIPRELGRKKKYTFYQVLKKIHSLEKEINAQLIIKQQHEQNLYVQTHMLESANTQLATYTAELDKAKSDMAILKKELKKYNVDKSALDMLPENESALEKEIASEMILLSYIVCDTKAVAEYQSKSRNLDEIGREKGKLVDEISRMGRRIRVLRDELIVDINGLVERISGRFGYFFGLLGCEGKIVFEADTPINIVNDTNRKSKCNNENKGDENSKYNDNNGNSKGKENSKYDENSKCNENSKYNGNSKCNENSKYNGSGTKSNEIKIEEFNVQRTDCSKWRLNIMVRFRPGEQLSVLSSHRQSGGEKSVSTMLFLLALQDLSLSPFKLVDEINQGMDRHNEKLISDILIKLAEEENAPQFFVITPKIVSGIEFGEHMRVIVIYQGDEEEMQGRFGSYKIGCVGM